MPHLGAHATQAALRLVRHIPEVIRHLSGQGGLPLDTALRVTNCVQNRPEDKSGAGSSHQPPHLANVGRGRSSGMGVAGLAFLQRGKGRRTP